MVVPLSVAAGSDTCNTFAFPAVEPPPVKKANAVTPAGFYFQLTVHCVLSVLTGVVSYWQGSVVLDETQRLCTCWKFDSPVIVNCDTTSRLLCSRNK